jgi:hypothetical protein
MSTPVTELCQGSYHAQQIPGAVVVFAEGVHPTSGYTAWLQQSPNPVHPPELELWHVRPTGIVLQVLTPFSVNTLL